jgi:hypothetical protein
MNNDKLRNNVIVEEFLAMKNFILFELNQISNSAVVEVSKLSIGAIQKDKSYDLRMSANEEVIPIKVPASVKSQQ